VRIAELAGEHGLRVNPLSYYGMGKKPGKGLIIGYAYAATDRVSEYGNVLADVIKSALKSNS